MQNSYLCPKQSKENFYWVIVYLLLKKAFQSLEIEA